MRQSCAAACLAVVMALGGCINHGLRTNSPGPKEKTVVVALGGCTSSQKEPTDFRVGVDVNSGVKLDADVGTNSGVKLDADVAGNAVHVGVTPNAQSEQKK